VEYRLEIWGAKPKKVLQPTRATANVASMALSLDSADTSIQGHASTDSGSPEDTYTTTQTDTSGPLTPASDKFLDELEKQRASIQANFNSQAEKVPQNSSISPRKALIQWEDGGSGSNHITEGVSFSRALLHTSLAKINVLCSPGQIDELARGLCTEAPFSLEDRRIIEEAAHFFGVIRNERNERDAFALYFILWVLHVDSPASSERRLDLLKSCAGFASSIGELDLMHTLLTREVYRVEALPNTETEQFLLHTVLAIIFKQLEWRTLSKVPWKDLSKEALWKSTRTYYDLSTFLMKFQEGAENPEARIQLDLSSYYILDFAFRSLDDTFEELASVVEGIDSNHPLKPVLSRLQSVNLERLRMEFLCQYPGTFGLHNAQMRNRTLRNSLDWCRKTLASQNLLPEQSRVIHGYLSEERANAIGIYWLLWTKWQAQRRNSNFFWDADTERVMGISGPELIWELINLAFKVVSNENKRPRRSRIFSSWDSELIQHAHEGTEVLARMSDRVLAESFLSQLVSPCLTFKDFPCLTPKDLEKSKLPRAFFSSRVRNKVNPSEIAVDDYVHQLSTTVFLIGMRPQSAPVDSIEIATKRRFSTFTIGSWNPTMLSSDTGSTLSSMKQRARKFARYSSASIRSGDSRWTQTTGMVEELSDSMSVFTISVPIAESVALEENGTLDENAAINQLVA
jgi:hypothetical protein